MNYSSKWSHIYPFYLHVSQFHHPPQLNRRKFSDPPDLDPTNASTEDLLVLLESTGYITQKCFVSFPCLLCLFLSFRCNTGSLGDGCGKVRHRPPQNNQATTKVPACDKKKETFHHCTTLYCICAGTISHTGYCVSIYRLKLDNCCAKALAIPLSTTTTRSCDPRPTNKCAESRKVFLKALPYIDSVQR